MPSDDEFLRVLTVGMYLGPASMQKKACMSYFFLAQARYLRCH